MFFAAGAPINPGEAALPVLRVSPVVSIVYNRPHGARARLVAAQVAAEDFAWQATRA
jgi:hypothetical protein